MTVRLEWDGKPTQVERISLPFQTVETINESRATRVRDEGSLLRASGSHDGWRNRLIWGDNKLVMSSLLKEFAGEVTLIYIDPPFATGDDFSIQIPVGGGTVFKEPSILEEHAYRDTWGRGRSSWFTMMFERLVLMRELLAPSGTFYLHLDWYVGHHMRPLLDEVFGEQNSLGEIIWAYGSPSGGRAAGKKLVKAHDMIFVYAKQAGQHRFSTVYLPYSEKYLRDWFRWEDEDGRRYRQRQRRDKETNETY